MDHATAPHQQGPSQNTMSLSEEKRVTMEQTHGIEVTRQRTKGKVHKKVLIQPDGTYFEETKTEFESEIERYRELMTRKVTVQFRQRCQLELEGTLSGKHLIMAQSQVHGLLDNKPYGQQNDLRRIWFHTLKEAKRVTQEELQDLTEHIKQAFASRFRYAQEQLLKQRLEEEIEEKKKASYEIDVARRDVESRMARMIMADTWPQTWTIMEYQPVVRTLTLDEEVENEGVLDPELFRRRKEELAMMKTHRPSSGVFLETTVMDTSNRFPLASLEFRPYLVYALLKPNQQKAFQNKLQSFIEAVEAPPLEYPAGWQTSQELTVRLKGIYDQLEQRGWKVPTWEDQTLSDREIFEQCMQSGKAGPLEAAQMYKKLMGQKQHDVSSLCAEARHLIMFVDKAGALLKEHIPSGLLDPIRRYLSRVEVAPVVQPNADYYPVRLKSEAVKSEASKNEAE